jgi:hypothetical protein
MLLATYALTMVSRGMLTLQWSYGMTLFWALVMESAVSPMGILVDATVVAGSTKVSRPRRHLYPWYCWHIPHICVANEQ